jgi:hypothetical protein
MRSFIEGSGFRISLPRTEELVDRLQHGINSICLRKCCLGPTQEIRPSLTGPIGMGSHGVYDGTLPPDAEYASIVVTNLRYLHCASR